MVVGVLGGVVLRPEESVGRPAKGLVQCSGEVTVPRG
jgi:hypothetical protein